MWVIWVRSRVVGEPPSEKGRGHCSPSSLIENPSHERFRWPQSAGSRRADIYWQARHTLIITGNNDCFGFLCWKLSFIGSHCWMIEVNWIEVTNVTLKIKWKFRIIGHCSWCWHILTISKAEGDNTNLVSWFVWDLCCFWIGGEWPYDY